MANQRADEVKALVAAATKADGTSPLNEQAMLDLDHDNADVESHFVGDPELVGYAQYSASAGSAQLAVAPDARRRGHGRRLAEGVLGLHPDAKLWSFGALAPAAHLASDLGLVVVRRLEIMQRDLTTHPPLDLPLPPDVTLRAYTPADADAWLAVNAEAFADHPEQGGITAQGLAERTGSDWFDPAGFLLAFDDAGRLLGFHWTKPQGDGVGEVYVIAVVPGAGGRGLGRTLLEAGLAHLAAGGARRAILYVDGDNERARELYERSGFFVVHTDVSYQREGGNR